MRRSALILTCLLAVHVAGTAGPTLADTARGAFSAELDVRLSTIRQLIEAQDYSGAEELASRVTEENPGVADGWMLLAYLQSVTGRFDASNTSYDRALERGADAGKVLSAKAYNCRKLGDPEKTRACYREIVELDRDNVEAWVQFAAFEASLDEYDAAVEYYTTALAVDPENIDIIESLARTEERRGNTPQARVWIESGLALEPTNTHLLKRLAVISLNSQDYAGAIGYCDRILAIEPDDATVHRNRAVALYQKGDKKDAIESFEKVRALDAASMEGLYGPLADCYRAAGRDTDALRVIDEGIAAGGQAAWLYSVWGKILEDQKKFDEAIAKFDRAVALNDELWSDYARKQIARQNQLKKREAMIAAQNEM